MKMLLLTGAAYLNGGAYCDAGNTVAIGDDKNEITEERAIDIVGHGRAEEVEMPDDEAGGSEEGDGLEDLTVAKLKELAGGEDVDLGTATTKAAIVAAIRAHRLADASEGGDA